MLTVSRRVLLKAAGAAMVVLPHLARAQDLIDVSVAMGSQSFGYASLMMAEKLGVFATHGIRIKLITVESGNAATTAMLAKSVQFSASAPSEALTARARHQPVVILANIYRGLPASIILTKSAADQLGVSASAPVSQRIKALDGLTIATPSATSSFTTSLKAATDSVGITSKYVYMEQRVAVAALKAGVVQAAAIGSPYWDTLVSSGVALLWLSGPAGDLPAAVLPTSSACLQALESYVVANPDVIRRMQDSILDIVSIIKTRPGDAKSALSQVYPFLTPSEIDSAFARESGNWTRPVLTDADILKEIELLKNSGVDIPGLDKVMPAAVLKYERIASPLPE
jgi:ABC-type nitrate/sulfonate/bicarbonate transport system substrate-binding protein